ncbi:hypothetical protein [Aeromicrobium sp. P5_D10]
MRLTNPLWYLAAFLIALGSAMAGTAVAATAFDPVRNATVTATSERVDAAGKSLAVFTNDEEHGDIACRARDRDKNRIEIPQKLIGVTTKNQGETWYLIAMLKDGQDDLKVSCSPTSKRPDTAGYAYATVTGYSSAANNGRGIAILGASAGVLLGGYVYWCRRRGKREAAVDA